MSSLVSGITSFFGGGGSSGPSADEMEQMRKDYWQTYSGWLSDEKRSYSKKVGTTKARLAAGGISSSSEGWKNVMERLEGEHQKTMEGFKETETYGQLEQLRQQSQGRRSKYREDKGEYSVWSPNYGDDNGPSWQKLTDEADIEDAKQDLAQRGMSVEDWYESRYDSKATEDEEAPAALTKQPTGSVMRSDDNFLAKQAKSPFAGMG